MSTLDSATALVLFRLHKGDRAGINRTLEMASVCLICGSAHIEPDPADPRKRVCCNCGFAFYRYQCRSCAQTIDSRDPGNDVCPTCVERKCTCGRCGCSTGATAPK